MDIHGTDDSTIPANVSNGYQYPKYTAPHGATFSDDGFFCAPPSNPFYCIGDMTVRLHPRRYSQFEDPLRRGETQRLQRRARGALADASGRPGRVLLLSALRAVHAFSGGKMHMEWEAPTPDPRPEGQHQRVAP